MIEHDLDRRDPNPPAPLGAFYRELRDDPRFAAKLEGSSIVRGPIKPRRFLIPMTTLDGPPPVPVEITEEEDR